MDNLETIPAPPSWLPPASRKRVGNWLVIAALGTGGIGAALTGLSQIVTAIRVSDASMGSRLDRIEGKLDAWRDELAQAKASSDTAARDVERLDSNVRALREIIASYKPRSEP